MNSNDKWHEMQEEKRIMTEKINKVINSYKLRRLVALDCIADIGRCIRSADDNYDMLPIWRRELEVLQEEVELCEQQIMAYSCNDNRMKLIPDRLL